MVAAGPERHRRGRVVDEHAADVGLARQQVLHRLASLGIEPHHPVRGHAAGPQLAVLVPSHVVGRGPRRRQRPLREFLGLGVEHCQPVSAVFGEPEPVLRIHLHAARPRARGRGLEPAHLQGLGIDAADIVGHELREVEVVLGIRRDAVDRARAGAGIFLERLEALVFTGLEVDAVDVLVPGIIGPDLAVDGVVQSQHVELGHLVVERLRYLVELGEGAASRVEVGKRRLVHHPHPQRAVVGVMLEVERAEGIAGLELGHRDLGKLAGLGIELADILLAEIGVPDGAVTIDDHVMGLHGRLRQVVFGDDDMGAAPGRSRQGLERVVPLRALAQIDGGEIVGDLAVLLGLAGPARIHARHRLDGLALERIVAHAPDGLRPLLGVVRGAHDPLIGVAAVAIQQHRLLLVGAGNAEQPLRIGELDGEVPGLLELEVGGRRGLGRDVGLVRTVEQIADRADLDRVLPRLQPAGGERVAPCLLYTSRCV